MTIARIYTDGSVQKPKDSKVKVLEKVSAIAFVIVYPDGDIIEYYQRIPHCGSSNAELAAIDLALKTYDGSADVAFLYTDCDSGFTLLNSSDKYSGAMTAKVRYKKQIQTMQQACETKRVGVMFVPRQSNVYTARANYLARCAMKGIEPQSFEASRDSIVFCRGKQREVTENGQFLDCRFTRLKKTYNFKVFAAEIEHKAAALFERDPAIDCPKIYEPRKTMSKSLTAAKRRSAAKSC